MYTPVAHKCLHPRRIRNPYTGDYIITSCNDCIGCLNAKSSRLYRLCTLEQLGSYKYQYFFTLTYDNSNIPVCRLIPVDEEGRFTLSLENRPLSSHWNNSFPTSYIDVSDIYKLHDKLNSTVDFEQFKLGEIPILHYPDVQLFLKRLRKSIFKNYGITFRFFITGEYGPKSLRPHWHILLYFESPQSYLSQEYISLYWKLGSVDGDQSKGGSTSYASSYVNSSLALPSLYKKFKIKVINRHSVFLGEKTYVSQLLNFNPSSLSVKENTSIPSTSVSQSNEQLQYHPSYDTPRSQRLSTLISMPVNGKYSLFPLDSTLNSRLFPRFFGYSAIKATPSLLQLHRIYFIAKSYYNDRYSKVSDLTRCLIDDYYMDNLPKGSLLSQLFSHLELKQKFLTLDDPDTYKYVYSKLYRFILNSKNKYKYVTSSSSFSFSDVVDYHRLLSYYQICSELGPDWFYLIPELFNPNSYINSSSYAQFKQNQEDIHARKIIRKHYNDIHNVLNPSYN